MNRPFVFTPAAHEDLLAIWDHIAHDDSETTADRVIAGIYNECDKLSGMPGIGHYRSELLDSQHRFWSVWSYLIVYRWQATPIQIIAVVHGARDLGAFFGSRKQER